MQPRDPEYDRFGPWIIEISPDDPAPPLFVPFLDRTEEPRLSLKVPRQIERRRAHPGMDLYDYVVNLYEEDMLILMRVGPEVEARALRYRDIGSLRVREDLCAGGSGWQPSMAPMSCLTTPSQARWWAASSTWFGNATCRPDQRPH